LASEQYEGLAGFRLALRRFLALSDVAAREAGVTSQQYQALLTVKTQPGGEAQIKAIADQMLIKHHGAVQLVDRLVSAGLVVRRSATSDRRGVVVALTSKGEDALAALSAAQLPELIKHGALLADSLKRLRRIPSGELR
jgi:DNA-binding MarR family transcriptional regulator